MKLTNHKRQNIVTAIMADSKARKNWVNAEAVLKGAVLGMAERRLGMTIAEANARVKELIDEMHKFGGSAYTNGANYVYIYDHNTCLRCVNMDEHIPFSKTVRITKLEDEVVWSAVANVNAKEEVYKKLRGEVEALVGSYTTDVAMIKDHPKLEKYVRTEPKKTTTVAVAADNIYANLGV